jgi:hypothetical protein
MAAFGGSRFSSARFTAAWHRFRFLEWHALPSDPRIRSDGFTQSPFDPEFGPNGTFVFGPGATLTSELPGFSQYVQLYNSFAAFLTGSPR